MSEWVHGGAQQQLEAGCVFGHKNNFFVEILTEYDFHTVFEGLLEDGAEGRAEDRPVQQVLAVEETRVTAYTDNEWVSEWVSK